LISVFAPIVLIVAIKTIGWLGELINNMLCALIKTELRELKMQLVIGNKNYSSWSLRPWLLMEQFSLTFEEHKIWLFSEQMDEQMKALSPSLKVPVLIDQKTVVWDSLAICEYLNDEYLSGNAWPQNASKKARARAICAEMHSGFFAIREQMPMNLHRAQAAINLTEQALSEVDRIIAIFSQCLKEHSDSDGFLFGKFSIADAFYMPIVARFNSYNIKVPDDVKVYMDQMLSLPAYKTWLVDALDEKAVIEQAEV